MKIEKNFIIHKVIKETASLKIVEAYEEVKNNEVQDKTLIKLNLSSSNNKNYTMEREFLQKGCKVFIKGEFEIDKLMIHINFIEKRLTKKEIKLLLGMENLEPTKVEIDKPEKKLVLSKQLLNSIVVK